MEETYFYLIDLLHVLLPTYMRNFTMICQEEVCKIDKPPSLSLKTLKNMAPEKMENGIFFFKFEILASNTNQSQILKNISNYCH